MWKSIFIFCLGLCLLSNSVQAKKVENEYVILRSRPGAGMFSVFDDVAGLIKKYEKGLYSGVEVDFAQTGEYYDQEYGPNWWQYYCQPLVLGNAVGQQIKDSAFYPSYANPFEMEYKTTRQEAHELIQKYFKFHAHITQRIDSFAKDNFSGSFVIGIHYRGTDKISEAPRVKYKNVYKAIEIELKKLNLADYKIFVATDEQAFIDFMLTQYGQRVIYLKDVARTSNGEPIHLNRQQGQYQMGEDAICDCCLLAKSDLLIRTSSNLSRWSTYFNPEIPVIELSQRYRALK